MSEFALDYSAAGVPVRDDLQRSHRTMLDYFRKPGCWFTGAERLAIASESRNAADCPRCREPKASLSPEQPGDEHARTSELPEALIEVIHRIRVDPQGLSRSWFDRIRAGGLEEGPYVELVGIVAFLAGLDFFCRATGIPAFPLPPALPGEPTRHRPEKVKSGTAWVSMLAPEDAVGPEADLYEATPRVPNIARALSLIPDHVRMLQLETRTHYVSLKDITDPRVERDLDRLQIELIAARVSALNECFY